MRENAFTTPVVNAETAFIATASACEIAGKTGYFRIARGSEADARRMPQVGRAESTPTDSSRQSVS